MACGSGSLQVQREGEAIVPWRQPRLRMPRRSGSGLKRVRSPPRLRGSESLDRGGEETATDTEMQERRSKQREDTRLRSKPAAQREVAGRTPPNKKRKVVEATTKEEEEDPNQLPPRGGDLELQQDFK